MNADWFVTRKKAELSAKLDGLTKELAYWHEVSEAGGALEKHHTQIRRVTAQIDGLQTPLREEIKGAFENGRLMARSRKIEEKLLAVHTIWEFFRSKLVVRSEDWFGKSLRACDELAWACYKPAQEAYEQAKQKGVADPNAPVQSVKKEPPLVFLNKGWSPMTQPRDVTFLDPQRGWLAARPFREVIEHLPVPVIGLPWYQVSHLPGALVIGHEVGHIVERDFGLTDQLQRALDAAGLEEGHRGAWRQWRSEIFADLYGCLALGPAYLRSLMDFIADDADKIRREKKREGDWGLYPSTFLRVFVNAAVLEATRFETEAKSLLTAWKGLYPDHAMTEFEPDVPKVVNAIVNEAYQPLGSKKLTVIVDFQQGAESADKLAKRVKKNRAIESWDARELFVAAALLYDESPDDYVTKKYGKYVRDHLVDTIPPGKRRRGEKELSAKDLESVLAGDLAGGTRLFDELFPAAG